jgi:ligand-binding sensor domain-containing protein
MSTRLHIVLAYCLLSVLAVAQSKYYEAYYPNANVTSIIGDNSTIWFSTYGQGIMQYDIAKKAWTVYSSQSGNAENDFYYCIAVSKDYIWGGSSDGLYTYDRKRNTWKKRKFALGGEYGNWIRSLYYDENTGYLWIGRFKNLTRLDVARQKYDDFDLTINNDDRTNNFKFIKPEGDNYIWFSSEGGIYRYDKALDISDKTSLEFFSSKENGFRGEGDYVSVSAMLSEKDYIWFGCDEFVTDEKPQFNVGGLYRYNRKATWTRIDKRSGLPANGIKSIIKTGNKVWLAIYQFDKNSKSEVGKGLVIYDKRTGKVTPVNLDEIKINSLNITALYYNGLDIWIGTDKGLWRLEFHNSFAEFTKKKSKK